MPARLPGAARSSSPKFLNAERDGIVAHLAAMTRGRHAKYGNTIYHLEPNVKEHPGGLRDLHVVHWLENCRSLEPQPLGRGQARFCSMCGPGCTSTSTAITTSSRLKRRNCSRRAPSNGCANTTAMRARSPRLRSGPSNALKMCAATCSASSATGARACPTRSLLSRGARCCCAIRHCSKPTPASSCG